MAQRLHEPGQATLPFLVWYIANWLGGFTSQVTSRSSETQKFCEDVNSPLSLKRLLSREINRTSIFQSNRLLNTISCAGIQPSCPAWGLPIDIWLVTVRCWPKQTFGPIQQSFSCALQMFLHHWHCDSFQTRTDVSFALCIDHPRTHSHTAQALLTNHALQSRKSQDILLRFQS